MFMIILCSLILINFQIFLVLGITMGEHAEIKKYPYFAHVLEKEGSSSCGGAILSSQIVITESTCCQLDASQYIIRVGSSTWGEGSKYPIKKIYHEAENKPTFGKLACLKITIPIIFSDKVKSINLPLESDNFEDDEFGTVVGFGANSRGNTPSKLLLYTSVPLISNIQCGITLDREINENFLCAGYVAGGNDVCNGDIGDPIVFSQNLVGIATKNFTCGLDNHPSIYVNVKKYLDFLRNS